MRRKFLWTVAVVFGILLAGPGWSGADTPESILNLNHSRNSADSSNLPRIPPDPNQADAAKTLATYGRLVDCACDTTWAVGDRVVAAVDIYHDTTLMRPAGSLGTVVCGGLGNPPLLVAWDDWSGGHDGYGYCECPTSLAAAGNSGWWVECDDIFPAPQEDLSGVCDDRYSVGSRVVSTVENPAGSSGLAVGTEGTVVCMDDSGPLVSWDSWHQGHDGNGHCSDPVSNPPDGVDSSWWVLCAEVAPGSEVSCTCDGRFEAGDRVRLLEAVGSLPAGQWGTVACGASGSLPLLVSWDNWFDGHDGNGFCECPSESLPDTSGYFVGCSDVAKEYVSIFIDSFENGATTKWTSTVGRWCPDGATQEGTSCPADGDDSSLDPNGGCNSNPDAFGTISIGETICGTAGTFTTDGSESRDTDWYRFTVPAAGDYTITINTGGELSFGFVTDDCAGATFIESAISTPGEETVVTATLDPGTVIVFVASNSFSGVPCTPYTVTLGQL